MDPRQQPLRLYGRKSDRASLDWDWVEQQLSAALTYWVNARADGHPHPRPVWGVWRDNRLHLSIGSPAIVRALGADPRVTVHLDSGIDVVIAECVVVRGDPVAAQVLAAYDAKYDWDYDLEQYGALSCLDPISVLAWRAGGWAGRDSFQATGHWTFDRGP